MRRPPSLLSVPALALVAVLSLALGACSSSPSATKSSTSTTVGRTSTTVTQTTLGPAVPSTTAPATTTTAATAATTTTTAASTSIPAVADPTDLTVEPIVSPGTSPPPTSLETKDLVVGTGTTATATSTVTVKYVGCDYTTGVDFTAGPWQSGKPAKFNLHTVVPGFREGIEGMKVGGRREIVIPPSLGYGSSGSGGAVKPNETLVFVVDLKALT